MINTVTVSPAMICALLKQCYGNKRMHFKEIYSVRYISQFLLHFSHIQYKGFSLINDLFLIFIDKIVPTMMMTWFITSHMSGCIVKASVAWSILYLL